MARGTSEFIEPATCASFSLNISRGGGLLTCEATDDCASLAAEGAAMIAALATDFARVLDVQVVVLRDIRTRLILPPSVQMRDVSTVDGLGNGIRPGSRPR